MTDDEPEFILPFSGMGIGDSFWFPTLKVNEKIYIMDVMAKDAGVRVKSFPCIQDGVLGIRVWRIK